MTATVESAGAHDASQPSPLLSLLPDPTDALAFVGPQHGLVGWGIRERLEVTGPHQADRISEWFAALAHDVPDEHRQDLVAFVSLGFASEDTSVAVIPSAIWRAGATGIRRLGPPVPVSPVPRRVTAPGQIAWSDDEQSAVGYRAAVQAAVERIRSSGLDKVVLSHDLSAVTEHPVDERYVLAALSRRYPTCYLYAVDGLLGASPEMLVTRRGTTVTSRVLAGTGWAERTDDAVVRTLLASAKNRAEHRYAVDSVADTLSTLTTRLDIPRNPSPLVLANLVHLATDVTGELRSPAPTALALAAALHPTGAVGGHPRDVALPLIRELEGRPRGRYAAPVGWIDGRGDGEFALALRGALVRDSTVRLTAGGGVVADSDPDSEVREAQIKMIPMRDALES